MPYAGTFSPMGSRETEVLEIDLASYELAPDESVTAQSCTLVTDGGADLTTTKLTGAASESDGIVYSPAISGLSNGHDYELRFLVTVGSRIDEYFVIIECRDKL